MSLHIRRAGRLDCAQMAELLNEIIEIGGTTAMTRPVTGDELADWLQGDPRAIWHVAEDDGGQILGFQYVEPHRQHGPEVANIATFARVGRTGLGIGSKLFEATKRAARDGGYAWINAEIRADNGSGLTYYQSRGFEDYGRIDGKVLADGSVFDKVLKRYDLD
ncbi:L-amino acid N-acyltransferase YncA [Pseudooceanicola antarcticus]|uniref:GNAT family N-acetyltransferase n=1 Tax=Pseudooceanicola antarcticus TaxID=1247613 RepID=A0A285HWS7_9RHOB|nr:GNAT family N-acetyltransferase [Pseudooceanicola antarcticus]PJE27525.1 GNAT family N-acetyltransferase [Pseudooceanicola antarcticus]SNY39161.1 L-amino acid N-acyltransferase YncA [Pseudooceanicola antarcticus]